MIDRSEGIPRPPAATKRKKYERFFMPSIYESDPRWGKIMEASVNNGVEYLEQNPSANFEQLLAVIITEARRGLMERAAHDTGEENKEIKMRCHAEQFGMLRKERSQRTTYIGDSGALALYKEEAIEMLKQFGDHTKEEHVWGQ